MKTKFILSMVGSLLAVGMLANTATAATKTANMHVSAKLLSVSAQISVSPLNFGTLAIPGAGSTTFNGQTTITTTVSSGVAYRLKRGTGSYYMLQSRMKDTASGKFISYKLYKDSAHSTIWSYSPANTAPSRISMIGNGSAQSTNVYATTTVQSTDVAGTYNDINVLKLIY